MFSENGPDIDRHADEDEQIEHAADEVRNKYQRIMHKYQLLLMKESMVSSYMSYGTCFHGIHFHSFV